MAILLNIVKSTGLDGNKTICKRVIIGHNIMLYQTLDDICDT